MKIRKGQPVIVVPEWQQQIVELERQLAEARQECQRLRNACIQTEREVQQALGRALGYPKCVNDQVNFPGSTEADGVFVGEHTAETLAMEAAKRIGELEAERNLLIEANEFIKNEAAEWRADAGREAGQGAVPEV